MPLQSIEPRRLYRKIADQLRLLIRDGEYGVGSRLPAERDLALQLGVSRPSVREALIALEVEGLVEVRPGSGVHVVARDTPASARRVGPGAFGLFEIFRARELVEGEIAALVARAGGCRIAGRACVGVGADGIRDRQRRDADRRRPRFHLSIAEASDNGPLLRTVAELYDMRNSPLFEQFGQHFENADSWRTAVAEHRAIVQALAAHDPDAARVAMHRHLQRSHDSYAEAWPPGEGASSH